MKLKAMGKLLTLILPDMGRKSSFDWDDEEPWYLLGFAGGYEYVIM